MLHSEHRAEQLDTILNLLQFSLLDFHYVEFGGDWGVHIEAAEYAVFHFVEQGQGHFRCEDSNWQTLMSGELVFLPGGARHSIAFDPCSPLVAVADFSKHCVNRPGSVAQRFLDGPISAVLLCGFFRVTTPRGQTLFRHLPASLSYRRQPCSDLDSSIRKLLLQIARDTLLNDKDSKIVRERMLDLVFRRIFRNWLEQLSVERLGSLCGLCDESLAPVLESIEREPGRNWGLVEMARLSCLSRSAFCTRFRNVVGTTPLRFLRWYRGMAQTL